MVTAWLMRRHRKWKVNNTHKEVMRKCHLVSTGTLLLILQGCNQRHTVVSNMASAKPPVSAPASVTVNPWYSPAPENALPSLWNQLDASKVSEVSSGRLATAKRLLSKQPVVTVSLAQATALVGKPVTVAGKERPYLVRAVHGNRATGGFEVFHKNRELWVRHSFLGQYSGPFTQQPLVLILDFQPAKLYVDYSGAL